MTGLKTDETKILVVDDEEDILTVIQEALESKGYQIRTAMNADEAFRERRSSSRI